jgi:hypothetical protein
MDFGNMPYKARGGVYQHATVTGRAGKTVLHFEAVVFIRGVGDKVAARRAEAHQQAVADNKRSFQRGIFVHVGHVGVPATEVFAVEKAFGLRRRFGGLSAGEEKDRK